MNLLDLPRELRDLILAHLLCEGDAQEPSVLYVKKWNTMVDNTDPTATKILSSSLPPAKHPLSQLCLVNRQLYRETKNMLDYQRSAASPPAVLKLDLLLDDLTTYYVSWLRVFPFHDLGASTVHVQIRPFYALRYTRDLLLPQLTTSSTTSTQVALWRLGAVINGLLERGPTRMGHSTFSARSKPFVVRKLILDVRTPELDADVTDENDIECVAIAKKQARDLVAYMLAHVDALFTDRVGLVAHVPWGPLMISRVREIIISVDGQAQKILDVVGRAAELGIASAWASGTRESPSFPTPELRSVAERSYGQIH